jgi:hypothetical protein
MSNEKIFAICMAKAAMSVIESELERLHGEMSAVDAKDRERFRTRLLQLVRRQEDVAAMLKSVNDQTRIN